MKKKPNKGEFITTGPDSKMKRAEFFLELLSTWERLEEFCMTAPFTPIKLQMLNDLQTAENILKRTYDANMLMDCSTVQEQIDEEPEDKAKGKK